MAWLMVYFAGAALPARRIVRPCSSEEMGVADFIAPFGMKFCDARPVSFMDDAHIAQMIE